MLITEVLCYILFLLFMSQGSTGQRSQSSFDLAGVRGCSFQSYGKNFVFLHFIGAVLAFGQYESIGH